MELTRLNSGSQPRDSIEQNGSRIRSAASSTLNAVTRIFSRSDDDHCKQSASSNTCEKPASVSPALIAVVVVVPIVVLAVLLFYLHRRNVARQRLEDIQDPHKSLDFGLDGPGTKKSNRKSLFMGGGEKGMSHKPSQLSMDMNLSSPYLLPPGLQQSHESLHSLARSLGNDHQDPYQQVNNYTNSETGSMRSLPPYSKDSASTYTRGSKRMSMAPGRPPRSNSLAKSSLSSPLDDKVDPFNVPAMPEPAHKIASPVSSPIENEKETHTRSIVPEIGTIADFDEKHDSIHVQQPAAVRSKSPQFELPALPDASNSTSGTPMADGFPLPPHRNRESNTGLGLNFHLPKGQATTTPDAPASAPLPVIDIKSDEPKFNAYQPGNQPEIRTSEYLDDYTDLIPGPGDRASYLEDVPPRFQQDQSKGLGVPETQNKRLSVGFRPLPPNDVTESDDPEYRANRIRSFYKEYFGDGEEAPPPMPAPPAQYYEDYDQGYLGEAAAYFDPETNAFVMPYAEPVTRRAMTPPPAGRRGPPGPGRPGPRPRGPHGPHGSVGGMSAPGGPRGRPRAGSAFGPRSGSSLGPRPDSSASARIRNQPKKKLPPPAPLPTLPTPSKLTDDSFSILNAADFAPPVTIRDTAAGRSQSPFGERRAYSPSVPAATPVVSAFEELAALPSPHLLRKSGTFTGLDFAPPKKFKNEDSMSDAGSIRSNRSGLSPAGLGAIRNGAGRVSKLPGDTVFTSGSLQDSLKPQWGMRQ